MSARVTLERMTCQPSSTEKHGEYGNTYVRININDKVTPLPYCRSGPGLSCPLAEFAAHVRRRGLETGDFGEMCGLDGELGGITFLHQE